MLQDAPLPTGTASVPQHVRFDGYEVDLAAGQLRKRGVKIGLREKSFQALALLLEHAGEVVTREKLRERLWPQDVFVDFDNNLNTAIARLRQALADSAERPRFIETLPRHGYRFIAKLSEISEAPARAQSQKSKLVVLPFANLSGDATQDCLCDAITEEIITEMAVAAPERLGVIARTTAMHYKGTRKDVARIGRELGVDYVVEGGLVRAGQRIGINVQLIQVNDQTHLWAKRYDAELHDLFSVESEVVRQIADRIGVAPPPRFKNPTGDLQAYNIYIQGRYQLDRGRPPESFARAKQCFEEAVARDPEFALAYDALAEVQWTMSFLGLIPPKEALATGTFYALRALEIDNTLAETHALLGQYRKQLDFDWAEVQREMNRALQLNPSSPVVRLRHAVTGLMPHARVEEAVGEIKRALESDPLWIFARCWLVAMLWLGRRYDQAMEQARLVLEIAPADYQGHFVIGHIYRDTGLFVEAIAAHRRAVELSGGSPLMLGWLGLALAQSGNAAEARAVLDRLHAIAAESYVPPTGFAWIHLGLGEIDGAFEWMDRAVDVRDHMMMPIKTYPFLDPIRQHDRYHRLLRKMNLEVASAHGYGDHFLARAGQKGTTKGAVSN